MGVCKEMSKEKMGQEAIGDISTILWTNKTEYVKGISSEDYKVLSFHGSTGNGKSMISSLKFMSRVFNSDSDKQNYILAGRDIQSLERRFVKSNHSVFNWYPFKGMWDYKRQGVGGARITVKARSGEKYIYLTPFNNVSAYSRILGDTLHGFMIDEAVESDELFLQEIMARVTRTRGTWLINTSNGGDPNHYFYTHILNKSMLIEELVDVRYPTVADEKKYLEEDRNEDWLYVHMRLEDNPAYDEKQIESFYNLYPVGSFMYNSRILGVRGFTLNNPFAPYMSEGLYIKKEDLVKEGFAPARILFSVDSGGHVFSKQVYREHEDWLGKWHSEYNDNDYGTGSGGHTGMITGMFDRTYKKFVLMDIYFPNHMRDDINVDRMLERAYNIGMEFPKVSRPYMFVDGADPSMLATLRDKNIRHVNTIRPAIKRDASIQLDEAVAISTIQQYMMKDNFRVLDTKANRKWFVPSMIQANLDEKGYFVDNKDYEADVQDLIKYIFSSMYRLLV